MKEREDGRDYATDAEWSRHGRFLQSLKERGRQVATLEAYDKDWRSLARWYLDATGQEFDLSTFTPMDGSDWRTFLIRVSSPNTVARRLLWLRTYATAAWRAKEIPEDLHDRLQLLRAPKPQPGAPKGLTADEARGALRSVEKDGTPRDKAVVFTFLLTGIRVAELCGLEVRDLTLQERSGSVHVRAQVAKGGRERTVPLPKDVRGYVQEYLASRTDDSPAVFVGQRGRMTPSGIRDIVARYAGVNPHRLRHTFAYEYLRANNNDLVGLADILGHASLNTTRTYTRRRREDLEQGVERVRYKRGGG